MSGNLFKKVCSVENFTSAWLKIKEKDSAGGIDKISVYDFERNIDQNLTELIKDIATENYMPEPNKKILIQKGNEEYRELGLLSVKDKIAQQAVKQVIEPLFEKKFLNVSYAYRPNKNTYKAIKRTLDHIVQEKRHWICLCDIDKYFDNISHELLLPRLKKVIPDDALMRLIEIWLKIGKVNESYKWNDVTSGVPQGGILSPLISNFYLHPFDCEMVYNNYGYVRYADDFLVMTYTEKQASIAMNIIIKSLKNKLNLTLNNGYKVINANQGFNFLGLNINTNGVNISQDKYNDLLSKLKKETKLINGNINPELDKCTKSIASYYGKLLQANILEQIDNDFIKIISDKLSYEYINKGIEHKYNVETIIKSIHFFTSKNNFNKDNIIKQVLDKCERKPLIKQKNEPVNNTKKQKINNIEKQIEIKKREYKKLEATGYELVINTPGAFIGKNQKCINVKKNGKTIQQIKTIALKNITILSQGVSLSSNVIKHCAENNISIDFLNYNGKPYAKIYYSAENLAAIGISQLEAFKNGKAADFVIATVKTKTKNQLSLLKYHAKYRIKKDKEFADTFIKHSVKIKKSITSLTKIDKNDLEVLKAHLFGVEGAASNLYWETVIKLLDEYIDFKKREKQGAKDLVNSLLNYGYGILYSRVWKVLIKAGLNPHIGYLHSNERNAPALVFDFIEQFRQQAVDRVVFAMITKNEKTDIDDKGMLTSETRAKLAENILERLNRDENYRDKDISLAEIMQLQANHLANFLLGKVKTYKPYLAKW